MRTYFLDLPDINTGKMTTWEFPEVDDPMDSPMQQATRRHKLDLAAARMSKRGNENADVQPEAS